MQVFLESLDTTSTNISLLKASLYQPSFSIGHKLIVLEWLKKATRHSPGLQNVSKLEVQLCLKKHFKAKIHELKELFSVLFVFLHSNKNVPKATNSQDIFLYDLPLYNKPFNSVVSLSSTQHYCFTTSVALMSYFYIFCQQLFRRTLCFVTSAF